MVEAAFQLKFSLQELCIGAIVHVRKINKRQVAASATVTFIVAGSRNQAESSPAARDLLGIPWTCGKHRSNDERA